MASWLEAVVKDDACDFPLGFASLAWMQRDAKEGAIPPALVDIFNVFLKLEVEDKRGIKRWRRDRK